MLIKDYSIKISKQIQPVVALWILRILVPLEGYRNFICYDGFNNDGLANNLGLGEWVNNSLSFEMPSSNAHLLKVKSELFKLHKHAELKFKNACPPKYLSKNIGEIAKLIGLSQVDCKILEFMVLIYNEQLLETTTDYLGDISLIKTYKALSVILSLTEQEVRESLNAKSILIRSGLLSLDRSRPCKLMQKLDLLFNDYSELMAATKFDPLTLLRGKVFKAKKAQLSLDDYTHINSSLRILQPYLHHVVSTNKLGVNILVYGLPGTGKSELARALAKHQGCELFEVASEDEDGNPVNGEKRLRAFRAAQTFFMKRRSIITFDEAEDVFNDGESLFSHKSTAQLRKAWINKMLEENPIPTIWISNSIDGIDPAFIRRFDMVFELPVPPVKQRQKILHEVCGDLIDQSSISRIAMTDYLAPAIVTKAASVIRSIQNELGKTQSAISFEHLITNTLKAQKHHGLINHNANQLPEFYDSKYINADTDPVKIAEGLSITRSARICLFGPPGTGKTAYAQWLAQKLNVQILVRRASDLMSMWLGENEKNIANAFKQADQEGAILLIDEVDSFLQDRRGAERSWEISMVNEMLTQMESFSGIFIASTNLMQNVDQAALRRFDVKVKFDYLKSEQIWELLQLYCLQMNLAAPANNLKHQISAMTKLAIGDFASVFRKHRIQPINSPAKFVSSLLEECKLKDAQHQSIGFI